MNSAIISIIIPIYNAEATLHRCINSILSQTIPNWELILVNDGSTDSSESICKYYSESDHRITTITQPNTGASSARNTGLRACTGEWVTFCDADDWVLPNWLENFNATDSDIAVQGYTIIGHNKKKQIIPSDYIGPLSYGIYELIRHNSVGYLWVKIFKRDIIVNNNIQFNTEFSFREDEDFIFKYLRFARTIKLINKSGYNYLIPDEKKYKNINSYRCVLSILENCINIFRESSDINTRIIQYYVNNLTNILFDSYNNGYYNRKKELNSYRKITRELPAAYFSQLSYFTRTLLFFPINDNIVSTIFDIKAKSYRLKHK